MFVDLVYWCIEVGVGVFVIGEVVLVLGWIGFIVV